MTESTTILLDQASITPLCHDPKIYIDILKKTNSTNDAVRKMSSETSPCVCIAESQTQGRGRFNRPWHSPFAQNIHLSICYPYTGDINSLSGLSLLISLAVCRAIETCCQLPERLFIKWPNDIICDNKKLGGNLIELQTKSKNLTNLIIGIGVNVNMLKAAGSEIDQQWTSLIRLSKQYQDRNQLCASIINHTLDYINHFKQQGLTAFIKEWQQRDYLFGQDISITSQQKTEVGKAHGINEQGHLQLLLADNNIKTYIAGDTTINK